MRLHTPEELLLIGTIIETYQRSGKNLVTISLEPMRIDLEIDGGFDMHLGEKVAVTTHLTLSAAAPFLPPQTAKTNDEKK